MTTKTGCPKCGHDTELVDGEAVQPHHLGCPRKGGAAKPQAYARVPGEHCEHGDCTNPKRPPKGKGPAPKYCEDHSDPKNRK